MDKLAAFTKPQPQDPIPHRPQGDTILAMRYAMIMAGGSGTRLWPMSTKEQPKQLIPFIEGRSLLQIALERLEGLVPSERRLVCAGNAHKDVICGRLGLPPQGWFGEPMGRDTLNAVGLVAYCLHKQDPDATIAVFTADHLITPEDEFRAIVDKGYEVAESVDNALVTFGIAPTHAATGFGYLQLGDELGDELGGAASGGGGRTVDQFKEKPEKPVAEQYHAAGPDKFLWNSGMFVWKAQTLINCIQQFHPENHVGLSKIAEAWGTDQQDAVVNEIYPTLNKISVDFAVMEPASTDPGYTVAAVPMSLSWLDVGSWPSFQDTCASDEAGNAAAGCKSALIDTKNTLIVSDEPDHLVATIGLEDVIVIHTGKATLVCRKQDAERIKQMHGLVGETVGEDYL